MERVTLLANHVLASEPAANSRLAPHAGKSLRIMWHGVPAMLPPPPAMSWCVTPAGLLEWRGPLVVSADLTLTIDASRPVQLLSQTLAGAFPEATIEGDAALAADVAWLTLNLRWDIAADLERVLPGSVAQGATLALASIGKAARAALARWA